MNANDLPLPPHSIAAEHAVLGGILLGGANAMDQLEGVVSAEDFYRDDHRRIFAAAKALHAAGHQSIDVITVAETLEARGDAEATGGLAYLGEIANNTPGAHNIAQHAKIVRQKAVLRGLCAIANDLQAAAAAPGLQDPDDIAQQAADAMHRLLDRQDGEPVRLPDVIGETLAEIDARRERGGGYTGLRTGFVALDAITGGLEPGQLVILAARPSVGKSALATNIADHVATAGTPVLFCTLEMSRREVAMRILAARTGVPVSAMRAGTDDQEDWRRLAAAHGQTQRVPLHIDDRGAIGVSYIRAKARRMKREHGLGLIIVDYLQLMKGTGDNRTQEIGSLSRGLKALAKELQLPIIALAQLNRNVENRQDKRPTLSDLRDSGEIEQDADIVLMLHREQLYSAAPEWIGLVEILVRKQRNGPIGEVLLSYDGTLMKFASTNIPSPRHAPTRASRGFTE